MKITSFEVLKDTIESVCVCENTQEWNNILNEARQKMAINLKVKGFRDGKVPLNLVDKYVKSNDLLGQASDIAQSKCYQLLLKENKKELVKNYRLQSARLDKVSFSEFQVFHIWQKLPSIELKKWKNFICEIDVAKVSPDEVNNQINELRTHLAEFISKTTPATKGDYLLIDYEGKIDGKIEPRLVAKEWKYQLGDVKFGDDFDRHLLAIQKEVEKDFVVTLPKEYVDKELASKKVNFHIKVLDVQTRKLLQSNEELVVKLASSQIKTFKDLEKIVLESLKKNKLNDVHAKLLKKVWPQILSNSKSDIPEKYLIKETKSMKVKYIQDLAQRNETLSSYLQKAKQTEKELDVEIEEKVKKMLTDYLIIKEIAEREKITVESKEVEEYYQFLVKNQKENVADMKKKYPETLLFHNLLRYKVEQFLTTNTLDFNNLNNSSVEKDVKTDSSGSN